MLTKRVIPCLDVTGGRVVKGVSFVGLRDAGDPSELASFYDREGADELVFSTSRPARMGATSWLTSSAACQSACLFPSP